MLNPPQNHMQNKIKHFPQVASILLMLLLLKLMMIITIIVIIICSYW